MNQITTRPESSALASAARPTFDLIPQTFDQALTLADYLAASEMVPKQYRGKPGDCLIAMQWGFEVGLKPLQALQSIAAINGKPSLYGDAGKALLIAHGCIIDEDDTEVIKTKGRARCKITRPGRPPVERTFSMEDAKTAGLTGKDGPWKQYPHRQLAWRAFWFAARDAAPDILRGMAGAEESADVPRDMGAVESDVPAELAKLRADGAAAAQRGVAAYQEFWTGLTKEQRKAFGTTDHDANKAAALKADQSRTIVDGAGQEPPAAPPPPPAQAGNPPKPTVTYAEVMDRMQKAIKAGNRDALDVAADWIGEVNDPEQRAELSRAYDAGVKQLEG